MKIQQQNKVSFKDTKLSVYSNTHVYNIVSWTLHILYIDICEYYIMQFQNICIFNWCSVVHLE